MPERKDIYGNTYTVSEEENAWLDEVARQLDEADPKPAWERVHFDIRASAGLNQERIYRDGENVRVRVGNPMDGAAEVVMPFRTFALAALHYAQRIEEMATPEGDDGDDFYNAVHDDMRTPIETAYTHPHWRDREHDANDNRLGFDAIAAETWLDAPIGEREGGLVKE